MLIQARNCQSLADLAAEADGSQTKVKDLQDIWGDGRDPWLILLKSDPWLSPEIWKWLVLDMTTLMGWQLKPKTFWSLLGSDSKCEQHVQNWWPLITYSSKDHPRFTVLEAETPEKMMGNQSKPVWNRWKPVWHMDLLYMLPDVTQTHCDADLIRSHFRTVVLTPSCT